MADRVGFKADDLAKDAAQAKDKVSDAIRTAGDTVGDVGTDLSKHAAQMKDRVSDMARTAADRIDGRRRTRNSCLDTA
jgi:phage host-nuclease inhibitor protein Gam